MLCCTWAAVSWVQIVKRANLMSEAGSVLRNSLVSHGSWLIYSLHTASSTHWSGSFFSARIDNNQPHSGVFECMFLCIPTVVLKHLGLKWNCPFIFCILCNPSGCWCRLKMCKFHCSLSSEQCWLLVEHKKGKKKYIYTYICVCVLLSLYTRVHTGAKIISSLH